MKSMNELFCELPKEHQSVLIEDKWLLANWAYRIGIEQTLKSVKSEIIASVEDYTKTNQLEIIDSVNSKEYITGFNEAIESSEPPIKNRVTQIIDKMFEKLKQLY
jgi:hypothetical protein